MVLVSSKKKKQQYIETKSVEAWSAETCGLRIKNITMQDHGFWRFTSKNGRKDVARGLTFINVQSMKNLIPLSDKYSTVKVTHTHI